MDSSSVLAVLSNPAVFIPVSVVAVTGGGVGLGEGAETLAGGVTVLTRMSEWFSPALSSSLSVSRFMA